MCLRSDLAFQQYSTSASTLLLPTATCRRRARQLHTRRHHRHSRVGNLQLSYGAVWVAAANPSYDPEHSNTVEQLQQQRQQQQQLAGAGGMQQPLPQLSGQKQHFEQLQQQQQHGQHKQNRWQKVQGMLQQYGPGAFFCYITCSNIVSVTMLSSAWLLFTRTTGRTPLQAGQWPKFLVFYAGAYAMTHAARPLKLAAGLACAPIGTALVDGVAWALRSSKAVALVVLLVAEAAGLLCCLGAVAMYASRLAVAIAA